MNKSLYAALAASLLVLPSLSRADDAFTNDQDKVSYSIGVDMARNLQKQGIDVNPDVLVQGIKDVIGGAPLKMNDDEMQATMTAFIQGVQAKMQEKQKEQGADNATKGAAYLDANKKKPGWNVTASGLQYKIITSGTGAKPQATDTVVTEYRGTLIDGTEFDSSYKHGQPAVFPVNKVIPGWTEALQLMTVGSEWQLAIPSALAYGDSGPPELGPNAVLLFDVKLEAINPPDSSASPAPQ
jgi:FKBP-type peptidyl-prolyl cis-trans isomerase